MMDKITKLISRLHFLGQAFKKLNELEAQGSKYHGTITCDIWADELRNLREILKEFKEEREEG